MDASRRLPLYLYTVFVTVVEAYMIGVANTNRFKKIVLTKMGLIMENKISHTLIIM